MKRSKTTSTWLLIAGMSAALFACAENTPEPTTPAEPPPPPEVPEATETPAEPADANGEAAPSKAPAAPEAWSNDLDGKAKAAFMKAKVVPGMGEIFKAKDPERYTEFGCKTCHGPNREEPKAFLPKLTSKGGTLTAFKDKPEVAKFMQEKVAPEMAKILGEKPYDPKTHEGFGCGGCHTIESK